MGQHEGRELELEVLVMLLDDLAHLQSRNSVVVKAYSRIQYVAGTARSRRDHAAIAA